MIMRTLAIVAMLSALAFLQLIGSVHQPAHPVDAAQLIPQAPPTGVAEVEQRALEELAAWPVVAGGR